MKITEVKVNADPKHRDLIQGTVYTILGVEQIPITDKQTGQQKVLTKQNITIDGVTAGFWPGRGTLLTQADCGKSMEFSCKAKIYDNRLEYSLTRPKTGGGRSGKDYKHEQDCKNRSVAVSYCLEHLSTGWGYETCRIALEMEKFFDTGEIPSELAKNNGLATSDPPPYDDEQGPPPNDDDIPF